MKTIGFLLAGTLMLSIVQPARAHEDLRQYKKFDISPDFEKLFKERLQMEQQLGPLKDFIKKIAADPSKLPTNPDQLKGLKIDDATKKALKDWVTNDPQLREALKDWLTQQPPGPQPPDMKMLQEQLKGILDKAKDEPIKPIPPPKVKVEPAKPKTDTPAKIAERVMKRAENTKLGDWLRDSPAWNRAFVDLRNSIGKPDTSGIKLGDWQNKLPDTDGLLGRLPDLPRPDLGRWAPSLPAFDGFVSPDIAAPTMPTGPSMPTTATWGTWLLLAVVCALIAWQMVHWTKRSAKILDARAALGPWPVQPSAVNTRAELVQAFDYLALLTLGLGVQCWNHHAVARQWGTRAPTCAEPAHSLAALYERARYTDGTEALADAERDQARRSLVQLAEAL
jgi:hypothetical protein